MTETWDETVKRLAESFAENRVVKGEWSENQRDLFLRGVKTRIEKQKEAENKTNRGEGE